MTLVSPGVEVQVIDESFYTPAGAGTVPMIFVATASNKASSTGTSIAQGTLAENAGRPYLLTSQRDLNELFGDPLFYSDNNNNMIHGSELNEYGLQAAYSALGVTNRVWVARADIDLSKLTAQAEPPQGNPVNGTYWLDTQVTRFGLLEWNASPITVTGGQTFTSIFPIVVTEDSEVVDAIGGDFTPKGSVGVIGDYAIVAVANSNQLWYKTTGPNYGSGVAGTWVEVGSPQWKASFPAITGTKAITQPLSSGDSFVIKTSPSDTGTTVILTGSTAQELVNDINTAVGPSLGIYAAYSDGLIELYTSGADIYITSSTGTVLNTIGINASPVNSVSGLLESPYTAPRLEISTHTQVPQFKDIDTTPAPSGSIWLKTTSPNGGAVFYVKKFNADTQLWEVIEAPLYSTGESAIYGLDRSQGGLGLAVGDLYVKTNIYQSTNPLANYQLFTRAATGPTVILSDRITTATITAGVYDFTMQESLEGDATMSNPRTITFTAYGLASDADSLASAIGGAGFKNIQAGVDSQNRVFITHKLGGEIHISDNESVLETVGFVTGYTANLYDSPQDDSTNQYVASNWKPLEYIPQPDEPGTLTPDGELWYNSIVDEVDIMVHDGFNWRGYREIYPDTDPNGPIVSASAPETFADGTIPQGGMPNNQLWIDTSDIDNYPHIYRYNSVLKRWIMVDKTDQTTENGVLFGDARWSDAGSNSSPATISDLMLSNYLDPDAPDPALYPRGMLLWNLRRSGFNVKRFVYNYIDVDGDNIRFQALGNSNVIEDQPMADYYPHRWVTDSGNQEDGSGSFGRLAQRKSVVQKLQALVNSNQEIRNEEARRFNLIACPGYPELIGEMITLNYDRRLTAFIVADTPARLSSSATELTEWANNIKNAPEDNDNGAVSFDEYMAMYYGWGYSSDNAGNNIVVPPSHMALRTLILNDQVSYPWFAPAGTRRGIVTNATTSGYINKEGEFSPDALNIGQRDVLYLHNINPITYINGAGLVVFGQKTRARNASALDRVNVSRLVVFLRVQLELLTRPYLFEPNDKITRDQVKSAADSLMLELVNQRALYDFITVCDESNNTPARIDRNELWLDIAIEPVKAIEFIYIPIRIKNTGEIGSVV